MARGVTRRVGVAWGVCVKGTCAVQLCSSQAVSVVRCARINALCCVCNCLAPSDGASTMIVLAPSNNFQVHSSSKARAGSCGLVVVGSLF